MPGASVSRTPGDHKAVYLLDEYGNPINPATEETLKSVAGFVTDPYDTVALTYVADENDGAGEIETATYKIGGSGGTIVAVLTITYNADSKITSIAKI